MSFLFISKTLGLDNLKTRTVMNAKISMFVICVEAMIYSLLYNFHDCTFKIFIQKHLSCLFPPKMLNFVEPFYCRVFPLKFWYFVHCENKFCSSGILLFGVNPLKSPEKTDKKYNIFDKHCGDFLIHTFVEKTFETILLQETQTKIVQLK